MSLQNFSGSAEYSPKHNINPDWTGRPFVQIVTLASANFASNRAEQRIDFPALTKYVEVELVSGSAGASLSFASVTGSLAVSGTHSRRFNSVGTKKPMAITVDKLFLHLQSNTSDCIVEVYAELAPDRTLSGQTVVLTGSGITTI